METHYPYSRYLQETFGAKTYKIVVASGLGCPVRCGFCDIRGSSSFFGKQGRSAEIASQIRNRLPAIRERFGAHKFLAYFQSYTNTYAEPADLRDLYNDALSVPEISGLCIGTRPDCLPDPVIDLLEELASRTYVSLELGVQSFENASLEFLERGHDRECSIDALSRLRKCAPHVHTCAHLIFGAPTDSPSCAREAALLCNELGVRGAKLHQLMILERSRLAEHYRASAFPTVSLEEYFARVGDFLSHLSPEIYLERLCATATHPEECIAPEWSRGRWDPHNKIRAYLEAKGIRQGAKLSSNA